MPCRHLAITFAALVHMAIDNHLAFSSTCLFQ